MSWTLFALDILRVVRGECLGCGCLAGVYETYSGSTVTIIDLAAPGCGIPGHRDGMRLDGGARAARARAADRVAG